MHSSLPPRGVASLIAASLLLLGCQKNSAPGEAAESSGSKPAAIAVVEETERSRHFMAVSQHLELGGTLYGYADIDGDAQKVAGVLSELLGHIAKAQPQAAPFAQQDYQALFQLLGFNDVKAIGFSSVPDGTGFFRNTAFFHTPEQRHGLLAGLGGEPGPLKHVRYAPADADVFAETELDVPAVYATVRAVVEKIGGEKSGGAMEDGLKKAGQMAAISLLDLINGMKGHASFVLRFDAERNLRMPGPNAMTVPAFSFLLCVDGIGQALTPALERSPVFAKTTREALTLFELKGPLPLEGIRPVIAIEGGTVYLATSTGFLDECRGATPRLGDTEAFRQALAQVGEQGNGLAYVTPHVFARLRALESMNPGLPEESKTALRLVTSKLPQPDRPLVSMRTNLADGILVRSYMNRSLKQDLALAAMYNPVSVGMLAAMAVPAFQKVRVASQEKTVMNNLRQLSAAAEQHYLENGVATARYDDLVGPDRYIRRLEPVAGEDYRTVTLQAGKPLKVRLKDGREVEYRP